MTETEVPHNAKTIKVKSKNEQLDIEPGTYYIWVKDNLLLLFRTFNSCYFPDVFECYYTPKVMQIEDIEYYSTQGYVYRENRISGGGGGGSSIGGAVVGGVIGGGAGAVIGSRKKNQEIKSKLITHDTRETFINFFDIDGTRRSMLFDFSGHQVLKDLIPQKDFPIVNALRQEEIIQKNLGDSTTKITEQIRELSKLRDDEIITEEDFEIKKKELLSKM